MEGFEKEARGGQARREPAAFRSQKKFRIEVSAVGAQEVTRAVLFFAASDNITRSALRVDGGRAIKAL